MNGKEHLFVAFAAVHAAAPFEVAALAWPDGGLYLLIDGHPDIDVERVDSQAMHHIIRDKFQLHGPTLLDRNLSRHKYESFSMDLNLLSSLGVGAGW